MIAVVGLGNADRRYAATRHNVGWRVVEALAAAAALPSNGWQTKEHRLEARLKYGDQEVILVKPLDFMNNSGRGVQTLVDYYHLELKDLWVIYDDLNLDLGVWRVRFSGSSGGHQGVESIIRQLGSGEWPRVRLGIGPLPQEPASPGKLTERDLAAFVLGRFSGAAEKTMRAVIKQVVEYLEVCLNRGALDQEKTERV